MSRLRLPVAALLSVVLLLATACTGSEQPDRIEDLTNAQVLVGEVEGGTGLIALVRSDVGVTVYTCGLADSLATQTGWFYGGAPLQGTIATLTSAGGLQLQGRMTMDTAAGTLTLKSGEVRSWTAAPARAGAGLYKSEDIVALTGLVVHNDGRMAGNARLAPTTDPAPPAAPVPVTVPSGAPVTPVPVRATFPVGTVVRTVSVIPVKAPVSIVKGGPRLVFLVHGMSDASTADATQKDVRLCDGPRNTPFYSRCEWGLDFIPGLFGTSAARASLFNLAGRDVSGELYLTDDANQPLIDEQVGITARDANGCVTNAAAEETFGDAARQHFVTLGRPQAGVPPRTAVFTTYRDSTRGLVESGVRITNQVWAAVKWYEKQYPGVAPALYFVGQSFGGLATRFLLSNPSAATLTGSLNADGIALCPEDRAKMDYLRDRTVLAATLGTPHEGSYLAELGQPAKDYLTATIEAGTTDLARVLQAIDVALPGPTSPGLSRVGRRKLAELLKSLDTPALRDLQFAAMSAYNRGPLSPERARRTAASPMVGARGALIPVYATLARSPGSTSFDSPDILELGTYNEQTEKEKGWIVSTLGVDVLIRQFFPGGHGRVDVSPYAPFADILDRRARLFDLSTSLTGAKTAVTTASMDIVDRLPPYFTGEFGAGVDGILAHLASTNVKVLPNVMIPVYVDRVWRLTLSGSRDVPMVKLSCGGQDIVVDYQPLVQALVLAYGSTEDALRAISTFDLTELVQELFRLAPNLGDLAIDTQAWFANKVQQLEAAPDSCKGVLGIANWVLARTVGTVPAPAWERTDTAVHDREMDADGPVHAASALGFTLGRVPFFFEHDRLDGPVIDGKKTSGSWHRLADNPTTEQYNHGLQYQNDVGRWTATRLLSPLVGPVPRLDGDSSWP